MTEGRYTLDHLVVRTVSFHPIGGDGADGNSFDRSSTGVHQVQFCAENLLALEQ